MTVTAEAPRQARAGAGPGAAAGGAVWRARLADSHRHEAARTLAKGNHRLDAVGRCPACRGPVVIGATVRIAHAAACVRRAATAAASARAGSGGPGPATPAVCGVRPAASSADASAPLPAEPAPAVARPARLDGSERHPHRRRRRPRPRQRGGVYTSQAPATERIRPWVVLRWFVSGARVLCVGFFATVRRIVRDEYGRLCVSVDFDDYDDQRPYPLADLEPAWAAA